MGSTVEYPEKLSDIIASLPEVSGGFLYSPELGVYSNQTAGLCNDPSLYNVSVKLSKIVSMMSVHFHDTGGIRVCFKDLILCGMEIGNGHWLFLLHQPSLSPGMIKMTVQMALNIAPEPSTQTEISKPGHEIEVESESNTTDNVVEILMAPESELRAPLTKIENNLAQYIGPVAGLVFQDSVEVWAKNCTPSLEHLPELVTMMAKEIDDGGDREDFIESLKNISEES